MHHHNGDDRRSASNTFERRVRNAVAAELQDRASLSKNGHTWGQWLGKIATPERVLLLLLAAITFGGRLHEAEINLANALADAQSALAKSQQATADLQAVRTELAAITSAVEKQSTTLAEVPGTASEVADMRSRIELAMTRAEFQAALTRQILPRLERIERALGVSDP